MKILSFHFHKSWRL